MMVSDKAAESPLEFTLDATKFFGVHGASRIKKHIVLSLSDRSYKPKAEDPRSDWLATVAIPAFRLLASEGTPSENFCTIGTGAGVDALAAIEVLASRAIFLTDLHDEVVKHAVTNISANVQQSGLSITHGVGDLLHPVISAGFKADILYENLPNIPLIGDLNLSNGQTSSTYIGERREPLPDFVSKYLLALHYVVLRDARAVLRPEGRILSAIGGRVPLPAILRLASDTGCIGRILLYTWKEQSEPDEAIGGYARWEAAGHGPFTFYPTAALLDAFGDSGAVTGETAAVAIEAELSVHALTATAAYSAFQSGTPISHTVAMLESTPTH